MSRKSTSKHEIIVKLQEISDLLQKLQTMYDEDSDEIDIINDVQCDVDEAVDAINSLD